MRLKITDKTDVDALAAYWGRGGRTKDVQPLMEAMAELPGEHSLPVTYLLPGFARRRIYTYPSVSEEPNAANRDCHWTALNFFNEEPDDRLGDRQYAAKVIASDYYVIYSGYQMGDLVLFMTAPGEVIHSAVYLADGVLFTKNGSRPSNPWMLVRTGRHEGLLSHREAPDDQLLPPQRHLTQPAANVRTPCNSSSGSIVRRAAGSPTCSAADGQALQSAPGRLDQPDRARAAGRSASRRDCSPVTSSRTSR